MTIFEAPSVVLSKSQRLPSANDSGMNSSTSQVKASNETLASNEPPLDPSDPNANKTIYDFQVLNCFHELYDLAQHKGSVVLICNVASKDKEYTEAGYTILTKLYHKHRMEGFVVLAFPCNEFGNGEPGNEDEIAENISCAYPRLGEIDFPIMAKVEVNGDHASPLFTYLKSRIRGTLGQNSVKWNFTTFLCDQTGVPYARFAPGVTLEDIDARVEELLHPQPPTSAKPLTQFSVKAEAPPSSQQQQQPDVVATESGAASFVVEDTPTPDNFFGCATPPPSEVAQLKGDDRAIAAAACLTSPPPLSTTTTATARGSSTVDEEAESEVINGSSSALLNKTTNTLEGEES
jgi:glutathione peroxidase-family protein